MPIEHMLQIYHGNDKLHVSEMIMQSCSVITYHRIWLIDRFQHDRWVRACVRAMLCGPFRLAIVLVW